MPLPESSFPRTPRNGAGEYCSLAGVREQSPRDPWRGSTPWSSNIIMMNKSCSKPGARPRAGLLLLVCGALFLGACAAKGPDYTWEEFMAARAIAPGEFFEMDGGVARPMDRAAFMEHAQGADYILIGEGHTNRCDHEAQATVLRWLATSRPSGPAVALEMVGMDRQPELDMFNRGELSALDVSVVLDWDRIWGHDFLAYGPVFSEAARHRLPLYAANLPPGAARAFGRGGAEALEPAHRKYLPETIIPAGEPQREDLREVFEHHAAMMQERPESDVAMESPAAQKGAKDAAEQTDAGTMPTPALSDGNQTDQSEEPELVAEEFSDRDGEKGESGGKPAELDAEAMFERFLTVQSLWDTVMAENAVRVRSREGSPVVVLAGSGHVDYGWGIALRLAALDQGAEVLLVSPWRKHPAEDPPSEDVGDVYFYCPLPPGTRMMGGPEPDQASEQEERPGKKTEAESSPGRPMMMQESDSQQPQSPRSTEEPN